MNTVLETDLAPAAESLFGVLAAVEGDPIFALNDEFRRDPRAFKANLGIGVYCDDLGRVPMLSCVRQAALSLAEEGEGSGYLPIEGSHALRDVVQRLLFGSGHPAVSGDRVATLQTVGASGALRVAGDSGRRRGWFEVVGGGCGCRGGFGGLLGRAFVVEAFQDAGPEPILQLEQHAHPGQVHAEVLGQVADPQDPTEVFLGVEPDVRRRPRRTDQALFLVDPQRARMDGHDARRHADHVDGSSRIGPIGSL